MRIQKIAEMQAILDDPKSPYDVVPAEVAKQQYGIVFAVGQEYNIAMCKLMVIVDKRARTIEGYAYKKIYCQARWCSQWDAYQKNHPEVFGRPDKDDPTTDSTYPHAEIPLSPCEDRREYLAYADLLGVVPV